MSENSGNDLSGASFRGGYAENVYGNQIGTQHNYPPKQNLAEAAAEIQQLLDRLSQTYPTTTEADKQAVVAEAIERIERNPTLKARFINALKNFGTETFKELCDRPLVNILVETVKSWIEAE